MAKGIRSPLDRLDKVVGRVDREMQTIYGGAQVDPVGERPERSANRLEGVQGEYELHRDSEGRTYLAPKDHSGR